MQMKLVPQISVEEAAAKVKSGDRLVCGGFGMTGYRIHLVNALAETDVRDITYIGNNIGEPGLGGGLLLRNKQLPHVIGSFFTSNREAIEAHLSGELHCELIPQGNLGIGGLQVDERGNLANWAMPGKPLLGVGGAMDLASGAAQLIVTMTHRN